MRARAVGDVRHRQVGDHPAAHSQRQYCGHTAPLRDRAGVRQLDTLRRAGRSRRVDQRQHVIGLDRLPGRIEVKVGRLAGFNGRQVEHARARLAVDADHMLRAFVTPRREHAVEEQLLGDHHVVRCAVEQVFDLLGGRRCVHGERGCPEVHHGRVQVVELWPVEQHQPHAVPARYAEAREPSGYRAHTLCVLGERQLGRAIERSEGKLIGSARTRRLKRLRQCRDSLEGF